MKKTILFIAIATMIVLGFAVSNGNAQANISFGFGVPGFAMSFNGMIPMHYQPGPPIVYAPPRMYYPGAIVYRPVPPVVYHLVPRYYRPRVYHPGPRYYPHPGPRAYPQPRPYSR